MDADVVDKALAKAIELYPTLQEHSVLMERIAIYAKGGPGDGVLLARDYGYTVPFSMDPGGEESVQLIMALLNIEDAHRRGHQTNSVHGDIVRRIYPTLWDHLTS